MKFNTNKIQKILHKIFIDIKKGRIMDHLSPHFPQVLYFFFVIFSIILLSIFVQNKLVEIEKNKEIINELKIRHAQATIELASFNKISKLESLLKQKQSNVGLPTKPANIIKK